MQLYGDLISSGLQRIKVIAMREYLQTAHVSRNSFQQFLSITNVTNCQVYGSLSFKLNLKILLGTEAAAG